MSCESYNLVKEGDLRNTFESGSTELEATAIRALYDGDTTTVAATVSGSPDTVALVVEFGESFDVCYVDYYTNEADVGNIEINYGEDATVSGSAPLSVTSSGVYRGVVDYSTRFVEVRHTVSGTAANIYQLVVIGTKNETLSFGESKEEEMDFLHMPHATIGTLSASPTVVPLFNDNPFDDVAKIAVAPTNTEADDYIHIATTSTGTYYGIDDYGFHQPGPQHISLHDDDFFSDTIDPQWEVRSAAARHSIYPTLEGLFFNAELKQYTSPSKSTVGIISKEYFYATSFTAEVDIRFTGIVTQNYQWGRDIFMVLTNNFPIPDIGPNKSWLTDGHSGWALGGLSRQDGEGGLLANPETIYNKFRWVDGNIVNNDIKGQNVQYINTMADLWEGNAWAASVLGAGASVGETLAGYEDVLYEGQSLNDLTDSATWHCWRLVYDHVKQELSGYVDNILVGKHVFRSGVFREGCKLFIGSGLDNGNKWQLRNFKMYPDKIYRQKNVALDINGGVVSATVSGTSENTGTANDGDEDTAYVAPDPDNNTHIRVDFDQEYDVAYYRLKQHSVNDYGGHEAFGVDYWPDRARTAIAFFGDDKGPYVHRYPATDTSAVPRAPTYSGTAVVASGISHIDLQFIEYDETSHTNNALIIEEIEVYAEEVVDAPSPEEESSRTIPWSEGRWNNLRLYGSGPSLTLKDRSYQAVEATWRPVPEYFQAFVDYGFSSAEAGRQYADPSIEYHHSETLFSSPVGVHSGYYDQWHSEDQYDGNIFLWRYFPERRNVKAFYWDSSTLRPSNVAEEYKFQYLVEEGDPNNDDDWVDIPPVTVPHPYNTWDDNPYREYRDFLIANNDGEFYTNARSVPAPTDGVNDGFSVFGAGSYPYPKPRGLVVPLEYSHFQTAVINTVDSSRFLGKGLAGYVELDEAIRTRGIRFVIAKVVTIGGGAANQIALGHFKVFCTGAAGSYTSPVFDTGTPQNTERLKAVIHDVEGSSSAVYVRSSATPPTYSFDTEFEVWRNTGTYGIEGVDFPSSAQVYDRALSMGDNSYYIMKEVPYVYHHPTDTWSILGGGYPAEGNSTEDFAEDDGTGSVLSPGYLPDNRVRDHSILLDGVIYTVCYSSGDVRRSRLMMYLFSNTTDRLAGWNVIGSLRPLESEYACMVGYGTRLYFFNRYGALSYFDTVEEYWTVTSTPFPTYGSDRDGAAACTYGDKAYIFGGSNNANRAVDIFDFATEVFTGGTPSPFPFVGGYAVSVPDEEVIYLIPTNGNATYMKYYPEEDRWEIANSLMWWRDHTAITQDSTRVCHYKDGYLYGVKGLGAKAKVRREPWVHGKPPSPADPVWGGPALLSTTPWRKLDSLGELMPQERYFQFKVEFYSDDREHSPTLDSVSIITPQDVPVAASGTASAFVKIGISPESSYQAWYTGDASQYASGWLSDHHSIMYTSSAEGLTWSTPVLASGTYSPQPLLQYGVESPWVVREGVADYEYWFNRIDRGYSSITRDIYQGASSTPYDMSGELAEEIISQGVAAYTSGGVSQPCVIKRSDTDYRMWFTGEDGSSTRRVFSATYSGSGSWSDIQVCLDIGRDLAYSYDQQRAFRPSVIEEGGVFRMWYTGTGSDGRDRILYTTSTDGVSWEDPALAVDINSADDGLNMWGASTPMVAVDGPTYVMHYIGYSGEYSYIIRAASPDGLEWFNHTLVFPPFGVESEYDISGLLDFFVLVNENIAVPGEVMTTAKLKIYNEGGSL